MRRAFSRLKRFATITIGGKINWVHVFRVHFVRTDDSNWLCYGRVNHIRTQFVEHLKTSKLNWTGLRRLQWPLNINKYVAFQFFFPNLPTKTEKNDKTKIIFVLLPIRFQSGADCLFAFPVVSNINVFNFKLLHLLRLKIVSTWASLKKQPQPCWCGIGNRYRWHWPDWCVCYFSLLLHVFTGNTHTIGRNWNKWKSDTMQVSHPKIIHRLNSVVQHITNRIKSIEVFNWFNGFFIAFKLRKFK